MINKTYPMDNAYARIARIPKKKAKKQSPWKAYILLAIMSLPIWCLLIMIFIALGCFEIGFMKIAFNLTTYI
jgi:hypothetical protein